MLGNDIVDLNNVPEKARTLSLPYLNKICSKREIEKILDDENAEIMLWRLWSMKESAYKITVKLGAERAFNPKKIETFTVDSSSGIVSSNYGTMLCKTELGPDFIHTVSFLPSTNNYLSGFEICSSNQSESVRLALIAAFKKKNKSLQNAEVVMQHDIPQLLTDSAKVDISLSHHGNYIAWAFENL